MSIITKEKRKKKSQYGCIDSSLLSSMFAWPSSGLFCKHSRQRPGSYCCIFRGHDSVPRQKLRGRGGLWCGGPQPGSFPSECVKTTASGADSS